RYRHSGTRMSRTAGRRHGRSPRQARTTIRRRLRQRESDVTGAASVPLTVGDPNYRVDPSIEAHEPSRPPRTAKTSILHPDVAFLEVRQRSAPRPPSADQTYLRRRLTNRSQSVSAYRKRQPPSALR